MHEVLSNALLFSCDYPVPMRVGKNTYGSPNIVAYRSSANSVIEIGSYCSIASNVVFLMGGNHDYSSWTTYPLNLLFDDSDFPYHETSKGGITVGNDVWIGYGATILDGSNIGTGSVIGAQSVVAGTIPPCTIAAGNPAKKIRDRFSDPTAYLNSKWWEMDEEAIKTFFTAFYERRKHTANRSPHLQQQP